MASTQSDVSKPKLSFAKVSRTSYSSYTACSNRYKVAASANSPLRAITPPSAMHHNQKSNVHLASDVHSSGERKSTAPNPSKAVHTGGENTKADGPSAPVQPRSMSQATNIDGEVSHGIPAIVSITPNGVTEENNTQVSSSNGSGNPSSIDGKSVASATTFALDEKESLRPDDSASVKAGDDEEAFRPSSSTGLNSRMGSDLNARAFRDQLREISVMDPATSQPPSAPRVGLAGHSAPGLLYAPSPLSTANVFMTTPPQPLGVNCSGEAFIPDEKLIEALNSPRDRLWVLKLEQDVTDFVKDST